MSFQPIVPLTGYGGWRFLDRTMEKQQETFAVSQPIARATDYFRENIGNIKTPENLVNDKRILAVALGAFGLDEDVNSTFFIRKILEDGTDDDDALANRLADNRYADFSKAFGFAEMGGASTGSQGFAENIIIRYETRQFERAVGAQDNDLRLAMSVQGGIADILDRNSSSNAQWFSVMGNAPMRNVFQTALGLPSSMSSIDVDQQLDIFKERSQSLLGTSNLTELATPEQQEKLIRLFLIRSEAANLSMTTGSSTALTLLQSVRPLF